MAQAVIKISSKSMLGATLIELVVTIVILGITMASLAGILSFTAGHTSDALVQVKTVELAQAYFEEIQNKPYDENTPIGGVPPCSATTVACGAIGLESETRAVFDDVDDYHGLNDSPPKNAQGIDRPGYTGYSVNVSVAYMTPAQIAQFGLDLNTDAKLITIAVTPPSGSTMTFMSYKGNF